MLNFLKRRKTLSLLLGLLAVYLIGHAFLTPPEKPVDIRVGSKNFTESIILGELYAQALEQAGFHVQRKFNLGGTLISHAAIQRGEIDVYPEYTGTGLIDVLHISPPPNEADAFRALCDAYQKRWGLRWLQPASANNSQGLVMLRQQALQRHIASLSDLAGQARQLKLGSIPEFEEREDGLKGLRKHYGGFRFRQVALYDNGLKYKVLQRGDVDVTVAFTTDGALTDPNFFLLADDRRFWPAYRVAPVIRVETLKAHPALEQVLNRVSATLDTQTLQQLNQRVDQQKQDYKSVVRHYLAGGSP